MLMYTLPHLYSGLHVLLVFRQWLQENWDSQEKQLRANTERRIESCFRSRLPPSTETKTIRNEFTENIKFYLDFFFLSKKN